MSESMLIGVRGWNDADAMRGFYPDELPADWRFCYYSNRLRGVLVPAADWAGVDRAATEGWREDSDPGFRFVLELPSSLVMAADQAARAEALAAFAERTAPIRAQIDGALLRLPASTPLDFDWLERAARQFDAEFPLCVDLPRGAWRAGATRLVDAGVGLCWRVTEPEPPPGGRLRVALALAAPPRQLRGWIEELWQSRGTAATAMFFEGAGAPQAAEAARAIAELLAV